MFDASRPLPDVIPKTGELARSSRRRAQPFLLTHCRSEGNRTCLPGPLCSSSREGVTHSEQVTRWARTRSCSRSSILRPIPVRADLLRCPSMQVFQQASGSPDQQSPKQSPKTDGQPYRRPWTDLNWSARLQCRLLSPLGPHESSAGCPGSIFPSQQRSVRGRSDR